MYFNYLLHVRKEASREQGWRSFDSDAVPYVGGVCCWFSPYSGRRGGLMVSALVHGSSGPGSSPGQEHCVVFLGKTLYSHSASLHPGV